MTHLPICRSGILRSFKTITRSWIRMKPSRKNSQHTTYGKSNPPVMLFVNRKPGFLCILSRKARQRVSRRTGFVPHAIKTERSPYSSEHRKARMCSFAREIQNTNLSQKQGMNFGHRSLKLMLTSRSRQQPPSPSVRRVFGFIGRSFRCGTSRSAAVPELCRSPTSHHHL